MGGARSDIATSARASYERVRADDSEAAGRGGALAASGRTWHRSSSAGVETQAGWADVKSPETYLGSDAGRKPGAVWRTAEAQPVGAGRRLDVCRSRPRCSTRPTDGLRIASTPATSTWSWHPEPEGNLCASGSSSTGSRPGPLTASMWTRQGNGAVAEPRMYQLIRQSGPIADRQFEIEFLDAGVEVFVFTFG